MKIQKPISIFPEYLYSMLTYDTAYRELIKSLDTIYDSREATAIANIAMEAITGMDRLQRVVKRDEVLNTEQIKKFEGYKTELLRGIPVQYCIGKALFMGNEYFVDNRVLIPRPETEELVQWMIDDLKESECKILDIGTGSGCIPISLKLSLPTLNITSVDISADALEVAIKNAYELNAEVHFIELNFLNEENWQTLLSFDIIVSNPPYIPVTEKENIHPNVKDHEPNEALFVPDNDPLLFYRKIADFSRENLNTNGSIYCELHIDHALQTKELFEQYGYSNVELLKDMNDNWRMLKVTKE